MSQNKLNEALPSANFLKRRAFFILPGALTLLACIAAGFYFQQSSAAPDPKQNPRRGGHGHGHDDEDAPAAVSIETVKQMDFPVYLGGLGTVTALRTVTVRPRVDGELLNVAFNEGEMVKAGDLLAEIDPRSFQVQLQQAEGQLLRDEALLKNAELDYERYNTLLEQDSIAAQQTVTQAAQVKQYLGTVAMDKAMINNAKLQLSYARLTAPISGQVGLRQIDQGNIVHANDAKGLVMITQLQPISVVFTLPEDKIQTVIQRWRTNKVIKVAVYDRAGKAKLTEGKLQAIDNQIDPTTGTLKFKAQFDNTDLTLFANQFVNIKMHLETLVGVAQVSSAAVQHDAKGAFVYVVKDNKIQVRPVTLGPTDADKVVILNNLAANEAVVVEGMDRLREGGLVDVAKKDGQAVAVNTEVQSKAGGKFPKLGQRI